MGRARTGWAGSGETRALQMKEEEASLVHKILWDQDADTEGSAPTSAG
jgi:hypothetical protein